jgi:hypothetical protein
MCKKNLLLFFLVLLGIFSQTIIGKPQYYDPFYLKVKTPSSLPGFEGLNTLVSTVQGKKVLLTFDQSHFTYVMGIIESCRTEHKKTALDILEYKKLGHNHLHSSIKDLGTYLFKSDIPLYHTIKTFKTSQIKLIGCTRMKNKPIYSFAGTKYVLNKMQSAVLLHCLQQKNNGVVTIDLTIIGDKKKRYCGYYETDEIIIVKPGYPRLAFLDSEQSL